MFQATNSHQLEKIKTVPSKYAASMSLPNVKKSHFHHYARNHAGKKDRQGFQRVPEVSYIMIKCCVYFTSGWSMQKKKTLVLNVNKTTHRNIPARVYVWLSQCNSIHTCMVMNNVFISYKYHTNIQYIPTIYFDSDTHTHIK